MDSDYPECLGCGCTVGASSTYCGKCLKGIKSHQSADERQRAALEWPMEERGEPLWQWHERMAELELPRYSEEDRWAIVDRARRQERRARLNASRKAKGMAG